MTYILKEIPELSEDENMRERIIEIIKNDENPIAETLNALWVLREKKNYYDAAKNVANIMRSYFAKDGQEDTKKYANDYTNKYRYAITVFICSVYKRPKLYYGFNAICYLSNGNTRTFINLCRTIISDVPDDFSGNLLDVPVGTAVFTENKWSSLKNAHITCIDYSMDMLEQARKRLGSHAHIKCIQGDVGNLQMENESVDTVVSMNGFHAFPDKQKAFHEIWRVLKPGGNFIACFYIKGKSKRTDWLVKNILAKKGWFSPPFQTEKELRNILQKLYKETDVHVDGSMVYFYCVK